MKNIKNEEKLAIVRRIKNCSEQLAQIKNDKGVAQNQIQKIIVDANSLADTLLKSRNNDFDKLQNKYLKIKKRFSKAIIIFGVLKLFKSVYGAIKEFIIFVANFFYD